MAGAGYQGLWVNQHDKKFLQLVMPAALLTRISYAAVRGRDNEPGAVQRVLSTRRINSIKDFTLSGGDFPANIILNWVAGARSIQERNGVFDIPDIERSAQIIDGQHRVAGLRAAIGDSPAIGELQIPVSIYESLTPQQCANIFLAINTEQKPVPKSLVYDLYDLAAEAFVDDAALKGEGHS